jgi:hypothetical protein
LRMSVHLIKIKSAVVVMPQVHFFPRVFSPAGVAFCITLKISLPASAVLAPGRPGSPVKRFSRGSLGGVYFFFSQLEG